MRQYGLRLKDVSYDRKTQMKGQIFSYRLFFKFCAGITSVKQSEHQKKGTLFKCQSI